MKRYRVKYVEKAKEVFGDYSWYNHREESFARKKEAQDFYEWLLECEKEGLVKNVSFIDNAKNR